MPLVKSGSKNAISANIRAEKNAGKPHAQSIAIALSVARKARKRADGGPLLSDRLMNETIIKREPEAGAEEAVIGRLQDQQSGPHYLGNRLSPERGKSFRERVWPSNPGENFALMGEIVGGGNQAMFLGPLAKTADKAALALAKAMAERSMPREQILDATGWFQGKDKKWRFEVPDNALSVPNVSGQRTTLGLGGELSHPELRQAYPSEAARIKARTEIGEADTPVGGYSSRGLRQDGSEQFHHEIDIGGPDRAGARSAAGHELQHFVQNSENHARGVNPQYIRDFVLPDLIKRADKSTASLIRSDPDAVAAAMYHRYAGEVEARNVQSRLDMTPQQRKDTPPWKTQDVPDEEQIVFFPPKVPMRSDGGKAVATARHMARRAGGRAMTLATIDTERPNSEVLKRSERKMESRMRNMPGGSVEDSYMYYQQNPREDTNPHTAANRERHLAMGGGLENPLTTGKLPKPHQSFGGGMLNSPVPGRTDKLNLAVPSGSYVVPSSVVSYLGQDNSTAGAAVLDGMFKLKGKGTGSHKFRKGTARFSKKRFADGGEVEAPVEEVPVIAAGGEYVVPPEALIERFGDIDHAHKIMDQFVKDTRKKHIKTLQGLPGPAK